MDVTNEQQHAADRVVEAALHLQQLMREARNLGVRSSVTVVTDFHGEPAVSARCYVREEHTLRTTKSAGT